MSGEIQGRMIARTTMALVGGAHGEVGDGRVSGAEARRMISDLRSAYGSRPDFDRTVDSTIRMMRDAGQITDADARQLREAADVASIQRQLRDAGYDPGSIDGAYGPGTRRALEAFVRDYNRAHPSDSPYTIRDTTPGNIRSSWGALLAHGRPDVAAPARAAAARTDAHAETIRETQRDLQHMGYLPAGEPSGEWDAATRRAMQRFVSDYNRAHRGEPDFAPYTLRDIGGGSEAPARFAESQTTLGWELQAIPNPNPRKPIKRVRIALR